MQHCEEVDDIYSLLVTIDSPEALTAGLRRTTDMVRGVLERSRGNLTLALRQKEKVKLDSHNANLHFWDNLCRALNREDLAPYKSSLNHFTDPPDEEWEWVRQELREVFR